MRIVGATLAALALGASPAAAVVGGKPVPPGQMRAVADIYIGGAFGCTGSLIAPTWVMTAGHCGSATGALTEGLVPSTIAFPADQYTVQLDSVYADGRGGESHQVSQVVVDTDYGISGGTGNDVTLLKLTDASKAPPMQIAALGERDLWKPGVLATIAGFGTTSENDQNPPDQMQEAQVPIVDDATCAKDYPGGSSEISDDGSFDPRTMVCAGYPQGGKDTCQGDSGGPLLVPTSDGSAMRLAGATSFGSGCAEAGKPGVYARVAQDPIRAFVKRFVPGAFAPEPSAPGPVKPAAPGKLELVTYSHVSTTGRWTARLKCTSQVHGGCHGKAYVLRAGSASKADSAVAAYRIPAGATRAVTIKLSMALRKAIRRHGPQHRALSLTALDGHGKAIRIVARTVRLSDG